MAINSKEEAIIVLEMISDAQKIKFDEGRAKKAEEIKKEWDLEDVNNEIINGEEMSAAESRCWDCVNSFQRTVVTPLQLELSSLRNPIVLIRYEKAMIEAKATLDTMREIIQSGDADMEERVKALALYQRQIIDSMVGKL